MEFHPLVNNVHFLQLLAFRHTHNYQEWNPCLTEVSQFWQTDELITILRHRLGRHIIPTQSHPLENLFEVRTIASSYSPYTLGV
jgi:hypothetical protein